MPGPPLARAEADAPACPTASPDRLVSHPHSEDRSWPQRLGWRRSSSSRPQLLLHPRSPGHRPTPGLQADLPIMSISREPARTRLHPQCAMRVERTVAHPPKIPKRMQFSLLLLHLQSSIHPDPITPLGLATAHFPATLLQSHLDRPPSPTLPAPDPPPCHRPSSPHGTLPASAVLSALGAARTPL